MRITLVYIQVRCGQPEGPEGNVSRYTMRPGTLGSTLAMKSMEARKKVLGEEHKDTLSTMLIMGLVYRLKGY